MGKKAYSTKGKGLGGQIKRRYSDFVVEEMHESRVCRAMAFVNEEMFEERLKVPEKNAEYLHLDLEKTNKELHFAIKTIARFLQLSKKRIGYAGLKDKRAVTCQRISIFDPKPDLVEAFRGRGIRLREPEWGNEKIDLGMLKGNKFTATIRDIGLEEKEIRKRAGAIFSEMETGIANFFGEQRFGGIRKISHLVGKEIVKENIENAVMLYLAAPSELEEEEIKEARASLAASRDYRKALREFPEKYRHERAMLNALVKNEKDYLNAFRALPKRLRFLFSHAYQSYLYNSFLEERIKDGIGLEPVESEPAENKNPLGLLPGYESFYSPGKIGEIERKTMEKEGISFQDFKVKKASECSSKGARRKIMLKPKNLRLVETGGDKFFPGKLYCTVSFELEKGAYATVLLEELIKP